ncbi:MAG: cytochrome c3 family protein, partial [Kiloniellaceae bacterium]
PPREYLVSQNSLDPGNKIDIGPYELVVGSQEGKALALTVELTRPLGDDFAELSARSRTDVRRVGLSKRGWSWLLFATVIVPALAAPLLAALDRSQEKTAAQPGPAALKATGEAGSRASRAAWPATADSLWISGAISGPHRNFGADCGACHEEAFVQVRDSACLRCHAKIEHHADPRSFQSATFEGVKCARCHKEHNGIKPIVLNNQAFCVSCHGDLRQREPKTTLLDTTDFGTGHPEFRPTVVVDATGPVFERITIDSDPKPTERSGLKFSHAKHLAKDGVKHPTKGKIRLACADCHKTEPGGLGMLPIAMEDNCRTCHRMQFDPSAPTRRLPHAKPREAVAQLRDFYAKAALLGDRARPPSAGGARTYAERKGDVARLGLAKGGGSGDRDHWHATLRDLPLRHAAGRGRRGRLGSNPAQDRRSMDAKRQVQPHQA